MEYRKFKADYLFTGDNIADKKNILITDSKGKIINIVDESDAGEDIEVFKGILSPGFINSHCHLELSHLKNIIPERKGLVDFVFNVVTGRHFATDEIINSIISAEDNMLKCGMVAVVDNCNNALSLS